MPMRTQQQQQLLQQIALDMGVPVTKQQGNNDLNIVGTLGLAGQMPPTPSQPFTANATSIPTILMLVVMVVVVVVGEVMEVEVAFHCLLLGHQT